jgi:hypothetical protein
MNFLKNILVYKPILFFLTANLLFCNSYYAQEENSKIEVKIVREVTSENKIESYIEIRDSVSALVNLLFELWGEQADNNGVITWNNVSIDSIEGKIQVKLYHAILKKDAKFDKTCPLNKKLKSNEIRVVRLRFLQKQNDLLASSKLSEYIINYFNNLLQEISNNDDDDDTESD